MAIGETFIQVTSKYEMVIVTQRAYLFLLNCFTLFIMSFKYSFIICKSLQHISLSKYLECWSSYIDLCSASVLQLRLKNEEATQTKRKNRDIKADLDILAFKLDRHLFERNCSHWIDLQCTNLLTKALMCKRK